MGVEELEALMRRCRPPEPSAALERRVLEEARRLRRPRSRLPALAAGALFAVVLFVVLRPEPPRIPGRPQEPIRDWTYVLKDQDRVLATLAADEAVMSDGVVLGRRWRIELFRAKGPSITFQADAGRFDRRIPLVGLERDVRIGPVDGFSSVTIDLQGMSWTATADLAARFAKATKSPAEDYQPHVAVMSRSATSRGAETLLDGASVTLNCREHALSVSGLHGRRDGKGLAVSGDVQARFEDGSVLQVSEATLDDANWTLRLKSSLK